MLLAIDFDEEFIDEEGIAKASVFSFQSSGVKRVCVILIDKCPKRSIEFSQTG